MNKTNMANMETKTINNNNKKKKQKKFVNHALCIFPFLLNHKSLLELPDLSPKNLKEILFEPWDAGLENFCKQLFAPAKYLCD